MILLLLAALLLAPALLAAPGAEPAPAAFDVWTWLTNITGHNPWVWGVLIGCGTLSRILRAGWPSGGSKAVVECLDEVARLRKIIKDAGLDAGPPLAVIVDPGAGRPRIVSILISVVSPVASLADMILWALRYAVKAALKRITGADVPEDSSVLNLERRGQD